jgi:two-component system, NarL family, invasion response regulator UvrY
LPKSIKVLIADDSVLVRQGLLAALEKYAVFGLVEQAATGDQVLEWMAPGRWDVAILNSTLVDASGIEVLRALRRTLPELPIVMLHWTPDAQYAQLCLRLGAKGVISQETGVQAIVQALRAVVRGETYLCPELAFLLREMNRDDPPVAP